jgi:hypothetical protein
MKTEPNKAMQPISVTVTPRADARAAPSTSVADLDVSQKMIAWTQVKQDFDWDGSWRDIYVRPATIEDWRAVCEILKRCPGFDFRIDGEPASFPGDVADVFEMRSKKNPSLSAKLGTVTAVFHFFTDEEIECEIDPREITSQVQLDAVLEFLKKVGDAVGKSVILTHENCPKFEIVRYDPSARVFKYVEAKKG